MGALHGRTALVTGGANGIGRATVARFASEGASVVAVDLEVPQGSANGLRGVEWVQADVTDESAMQAVVAGIAEPQRLDICVANAGIARVEDFVAGCAASWDQVIRVNLLGAMVTLHAAATRMVADSQGGCLLATASISGLRGEPHAPAYSASKGGVIALMKSLAVELAPYGITANAVAPGMIDTGLSTEVNAELSRRAGKSPEDFEAQYLAQDVPAGRLGRPEEVAGLFCFLASSEANFISGATVRIDGAETTV